MKLYNRKPGYHLEIIAKYIYQFIPENYFKHDILDFHTYETIIKPLSINFTAKGKHPSAKGFIKDSFTELIVVTRDPNIGSKLLSNIYKNLIIFVNWQGSTKLLLAWQVLKDEL